MDGADASHLQCMWGKEELTLLNKLADRLIKRWTSGVSQTNSTDDGAPTFSIYLDTLGVTVSVSRIEGSYVCLNQEGEALWEGSALTGLLKQFDIPLH